MQESAFRCHYRHGFARIAVAVPPVRVADPGYNAEQTLRLAQRATDDRAIVTVFPELGLSSYTADDLFHQGALDAAAQYDITYENVQAGERTAHLFRLANMHRGLVVGTGDLSELAMGWCTFGVGDHMAHYSVNASVPKTLIEHLISWNADSGDFEPCR